MPPAPPHCRVVVTGDDVWEDLTTALEQTRLIATAADMAVTLESGLARLTAEPSPSVESASPSSPLDGSVAEPASSVGSEAKSVGSASPSTRPDTSATHCGRPGDPDVVVLLTAGGEFTPDQQKRVDTMVREGMGLLAIHCTAFFPGLNADGPLPGADDYWATAFNLVGVRYDSHGPMPHDTTFTVHLTSDHPITTGLEDFPITHEHYHMVMADPRPHVLAWRDAACGPEPIMTAKDHGAGRVVYLQLGHDMRTFGEPAVRELIRRALTWVTRPTQARLADGAHSDADPTLTDATPADRATTVNCPTPGDCATPADCGTTVDRVTPTDSITDHPVVVSEASR